MNRSIDSNWLKTCMAILTLLALTSIAVFAASRNMSHPPNRQVADPQITKPGSDGRPSSPAKINVTPTNGMLENDDVERDAEFMTATTTRGIVLIDGKLEVLPLPNQSNR
jgi:hypothetical protein